MKQLCSVLLAFLLMLGVFPATAWAADVTGLTSASVVAFTSANSTAVTTGTPNDTVDIGTVASGSNIVIGINPAALTSTGSFDPSGITWANITSNIGTLGHNESGQPQLIIPVTETNATYADKAMSSINVTLTDAGNSYTSKALTITGKIRATGSALKSFADSSTVNGGTHTWSTGTTYVDIPLTGISYNKSEGGTTTLSAAVLSNQFNSTVSTGNANYTAAINGTNIRITSANPVNANLTLTLSGTASDGTMVSKSITASITLAEPTITGVAVSSLHWNLASTVNVGDTSTVTIAKENLAWQNGDRALTASDITTIQGWFSVSPVANLEVTNWSASGGTLLVTIRAKAAGTGLNATASLSTGGNTASAAVSGVTILNAGNPAIIGVASGISPGGSIPSSLQLGQSITLTFGINNFTWETNNTNRTLADKLTQVQGYVTGLPSETNFSRRWSVSQSTVTLTLTSLRAGTYPLNVGLSGGGSISGSVSIQSVSVSGNKITGISSSASLGNNVILDGNAGADAEDLEVHPGSILYLDLDSSYFTWENGTPVPVANVTTGMLRTGKITVQYQRRSGSNVIKDVSLVNESGRARIKVEFASVLSSLEEKSFKVDIYLREDGKRHTGSSVQLAGVMENKSQDAYDGAEYYDITESPILEAQDTIRNAELYVGRDIYIHTTLYKNRKYYAAIEEDYSSSDLSIMNRTSYIEDVVHLETQNIPSSAKVSFDIDNRYYVYNEAGKYLGTTSEKIALSSTYYLSSRRVSFLFNNNTSIDKDNSSTNNSSSTSTPSNNSSGSSNNTSNSGAGNSSSGNNNQSYNPPTGAITFFMAP